MQIRNSTIATHYYTSTTMLHYNITLMLNQLTPITGVTASETKVHKVSKVHTQFTKSKFTKANSKLKIVTYER